MSDTVWCRLRTRALLSAVLCAVGCGLWDGSHFDTFSVQPETIENVEPFDLDDMATKEKAAEDEPPAEKVQLTIEDCRASAIEGNLAIQVTLFNPEIAKETVTEATAVFEPYLFSNFSFAKTDTPTSIRLDAVQAETYYNNAGLRIPLRTGGQVTVDTNFVRSETDNEFSTLNPAYSTDLGFSINQPLLRGGGIRTSTHGIRLARYGLQMEQARTHLQLITVLAAVDRVYWRLYAAREELRVRKQEYDLAVAQLERAQRMVQAQETAEIEVIRADEAAAQRLEGIILAENAVLDRERELKLVLNKPGLAMETPTIIETETLPAPVRYELDRQRLVAYALEHRMELLELQLQIASDTSTLNFEKNGLLPLLSVNYTYNMNGLGGSSHGAYDLMLENRFGDHRAGLVLQIPIGNQAAASRVRRTMAVREQRLATEERRILLIKQEVLKAADQLEANWQRVLASRRGTVLAKRTMDAEERRFKEGLQTSIEVLDAQTRYANARTAELRALVEYQIAQVDLAFAAGSLLGAARIHWDLGTNELSLE